MSKKLYVGDDEIGFGLTDLFGGVHLLGKTVLSAFGMGKVGDTLQQVESPYLPGWAGGTADQGQQAQSQPSQVQTATTSQPQSSLVTGADYVVIAVVSTGGQKKPVAIAKPDSVTVIGGHRFAGNGYRGVQDLPNKFSFGYDSPQRVDVVFHGTKTSLQSPSQVLLCGGSEKATSISGEVMGKNDIGFEFFDMPPALGPIRGIGDTAMDFDDDYGVGAYAPQGTDSANYGSEMSMSVIGDDYNDGYSDGYLNVRPQKTTDAYRSGYLKGAAAAAAAMATDMLGEEKKDPYPRVDTPAPPPGTLDPYPGKVPDPYDRVGMVARGYQQHVDGDGFITDDSYSVGQYLASSVYVASNAKNVSYVTSDGQYHQLGNVRVLQVFGVASQPFPNSVTGSMMSLSADGKVADHVSSVMIDGSGKFVRAGAAASPQTSTAPTALKFTQRGGHDVVGALPVGSKVVTALPAATNPYLKGAIASASKPLAKTPPAPSTPFGFQVKTSPKKGRQYTAMVLNKDRPHDPKKTVQAMRAASQRAQQTAERATPLIAKAKAQLAKSTAKKAAVVGLFGKPAAPTKAHLSIAALEQEIQKLGQSGVALSKSADKYEKAVGAQATKDQAAAKQSQTITHIHGIGDATWDEVLGQNWEEIVEADVDWMDDCVGQALTYTPVSQSPYGATLYGAASSPYGTVSPYGAPSPYGTVSPYGTSPYGAAPSPYGTVSPYGTATPGISPTTGMPETADPNNPGYYTDGTPDYSDAQVMNASGQMVANPNYNPQMAAGTGAGTGGPPDYGAGAPPVLNGNFITQNDGTQWPAAGQDYMQDPVPSGLDSNFYDAASDDLLPPGAVVFDGSHQMEVDGNGWAPVASRSVYGDGTVDGTPPNGGPYSGFELHNDGWWLHLTGRAPTGTYHGSENYDHKGDLQAGMGAAGYAGATAGFGPLIGNPNDWTAGLRFSPSGPNGPRWFWFYDRAPSWAVANILQAKLGDLMAQYKAAVVAGQTNYVNQQLQDQLNAQQAQQMAQQQAVQDQQLAMQQQVADQQNAISQNQYQQQLQTAQLQDASAQGKLQQQQQAQDLAVQNLQLQYFAQHPEDMFVSADQSADQGGGDGGGDGDGSQDAGSAYGNIPTSDSMYSGPPGTDWDSATTSRDSEGLAYGDGGGDDSADSLITEGDQL